MYFLDKAAVPLTSNAAASDHTAPVVEGRGEGSSCYESLGTPEPSHGVSSLPLAYCWAELRNVSQIHSRSPQSLLSDSIFACMTRLNVSGDDDVIRFFFRNQVNTALRAIFGRLRSTDPSPRSPSRGRLRNFPSSSFSRFAHRYRVMGIRSEQHLHCTSQHGKKGGFLGMMWIRSSSALLPFTLKKK